jgi:MFS family permease
MLSLTVLLVVAEHRSLAIAGLALSGYTLGQAGTAPIRGRLADRYGLARVAAACLLGYGLSLIALLVSTASHAPSAVPVAAATLAGLLTPPLSAGMRGLWSAATPPALRHTAFALDAAVFDLCFIAGPAVASTLATALRPAAALGLLLVLVGVAVLVLARVGRPVATGNRARLGWLGVLRVPALRRLLLTAALANLALAAVEVSLTAFARHAGVVWASGPLLAGVSIGSVIGSLSLGRRPPPTGTARNRLPRLLAGYTAGLIVLSLATLFPPLLAVAAPLAGLCLGPTLATLFTTAAETAPAGNATETQSWVNTIMSGGAALGAAAAGLTAAHPAIGLSLAAATAGLAALTAILTAVE